MPRARIAGVLARDRTDQRIGRARLPVLRQRVRRVGTRSMHVARRAAATAGSRPRRPPSSAPATIHGANRFAAPRAIGVTSPIRAALPPIAWRSAPSTSALRFARRKLRVAGGRADHGGDLEQRAIVGAHRGGRRATGERLVDQIGERLRVRALGRRCLGLRIGDRGRSRCRRRRLVAIDRPRWLRPVRSVCETRARRGTAARRTCRS